MNKIIFNMELNVSVEEHRSNVEQNIKRDIARFVPSDPHDGAVKIVCPGGSLEGQIDNVRNMSGKIIAVNRAYDQLINLGIIPDAYMLLDSSDILLGMIKNIHPKTTVFIASQCSPNVFDALEGHEKKVLYHAYVDGIHDILEDEKETVVIHGGGVVGLKALYLAYLAGYRKVDYFGLDGSVGETIYSFGDDMDIGDTMQVTYGGRTFDTYPSYAASAQDFFKMVKVIPDCAVTVHGDGLIQHIARTLNGMATVKDQSQGQHSSGNTAQAAT